MTQKTSFHTSYPPAVFTGRFHSPGKPAHPTADFISGSDPAPARQGPRE